ncbi:MULTISPECIES: glycosyl transferase [Streptomyces]|uniref:Glycosyl transferase n=1 Tax=Streptomyces glycanivorans TaxID=3033808 RepID=A0ABY9J8J4_9ACTN|nr:MULTISPECIES: glycosyl transferase [unclassified Streptomyces]WSQ82277.1 glycosyl transferase [Streptomyces sp. NBC_01213]TXS19090.1 glycosyl transferase [Streptomyces sp. wa22]WLQ64116.1 glycosyl transferase [Streptomyces sp. Alt3]WSQ89600.1 glycosyl transferase [Streptomyces sp. NBC_01212]WSR11415.1 glycosyl transferase [Streptomyces sp. NBC_01208]
MPTEGHDHDSGAAGPLATGYRVRYRRPARTGAAVLLLPVLPAVTGLLLLHALWPTHWTHGGSGRRWLVLADSLTLVSVGTVELFLLANVAAVAYAVSVARDPVPVTPEPGTGLALLTTYTPGREPLSAVRATLEAAVHMRHPGPLDVWLLDEGDDPEARMLCAELGVHHFTRLGVPEWNRGTGPHKAGTKRGNVNAWLAKHGDAYDLVVSADAGHVPQPEALERTTGWFRDPDIAFVVGPRDEAPASPRPLLGTLVQRAGNRYGAPLLDGTGSVVRVTALRQAGGFHDSVTDATVTGFEIHRLRNPLTGRYWRSVHAADLPGAGKEPVSWADLGDRRPRRSRGAYGTLLRQYGKALFRVPPGRLVGYTLTLARGPVEAATWLFAALSCLLVLTHAQLRPWAVLALVTALAPLALWSLALLRGRAARTVPGRSPAQAPVQEPEPALTVANASTPTGGN